MRCFVFFLFLVVGLCQVSNADLIFTLEQATPGPIVIGTNAVFNVFAQANNGGPGNRDNSAGITNLAGIDFSLNADDADASTDDTDGGAFTAGTNIFPTDPYQIPFTTSFVQYGGNVNAEPTLTVSSSNRLLIASLTLGTSDLGPLHKEAKAGTYTMELGNIFAVNVGFAAFTISSLSTSSIPYTITAVPEPSSMVLIGLAGCGLLAAKRFRRKLKATEAM
jgi:hypothetical protein